MKDEVNTNESASIAVLPTLGHEMIALKSKKYEDWIEILPLPGQKLRAMGALSAQGFAISMLVLVFLYGPDFLMDYSKRNEQFLIFFAKFFVTAVLLVAFCAFIALMIRKTSIFVHVADKKLVCARHLTDKTIREAAPFSDIESVEIEPPSGIFKKARLMIKIYNTRVTLAESYGSSADLEAVSAWFNELRNEKTEDQT